jgi:hypothetical protein
VQVTVNEILLRVVVGGVVVSAFSLLGDLLRPRTFAGLFGAAPSVALLVLTVAKDGKAYASLEARSMVFGAVAFFFYASVVGRLLIRQHLPVLRVTSLAMLLWFVCAFGLCYAALGFGR